ncbi:MAG: hypothetical protein C4305_09260, partial [Thermoleophilia bacterium]
MGDTVERALELSAEWDEELRRELPSGASLLDAHVHLGTDIDGMRGDYDELLGLMDRYRVDRAFVFCMDEPDRHPAFRAPNDRTLAAAERSQGRLVPFARLDLAESPVEEAERCLARGARGIKLHPRAQGFLLTDERLDPVFALAAERGVPILIHGGRGLPPIAEALGRLVERHPGAQLIVAHAGIADMAGLARVFAGRPGVFFDTSVWSPIDLLDCFRQVPPEQIVYASDYPYGQQPASLLVALRAARASGIDEERLLEVLGGNAAGLPPRLPGAPAGGSALAQPLILARIHSYLAMVTPLLWLRQPDAYGILGLALNACQERDGAVDEETLGRISALLSAARDLWRTLPE